VLSGDIGEGKLTVRRAENPRRREYALPRRVEFSSINDVINKRISSCSMVKRTRQRSATSSSPAPHTPLQSVLAPLRIFGARYR